MVNINKKIILKRIILLILIFLNFIMIFGFSSQNGEKSGGLSTKVTVFVLDIFGQGENNINQEQIETVEYVIRKLAHFSIYMILGMLLMDLASTYEIKNITKIFTSICVGILYASLDEFHQSFTPGRTALVTDVFIDTLGVITGVMIIFGIIELWKKNKNKNKIFRG